MLDTLLSSAAHSVRANRLIRAGLDLTATDISKQVRDLSVILTGITSNTIVDPGSYRVQLPITTGCLTGCHRPGCS
jgi:hypothetical protein